MVAAGEAAQRDALVALQRRLWESVPLIPVGQFIQPNAWRNSVGGILKSHIIVFWNIEKG